MVTLFLYLTIFLNILSKYNNSLAMNSYMVTLKDTIARCDGKDFYDKIMDLADFGMVEDDEGDVRMVGSFKMLMDMENPLKIKTDFYRNFGGKWAKIPVSYIVLDFCKVEYSEDEIWYRITKEFEGDERICPPKKDQVLSLRNVTVGGTYTFGARLEHGEYRADISIYYKNVPYCVRYEGRIEKP